VIKVSSKSNPCKCGECIVVSDARKYGTANPMYEYKVEYKMPRQLAIPQDGEEWIIAETVSAGIAQTALQAARKDARLLRRYAAHVRITRDGKTVR